MRTTSSFARARQSSGTADWSYTTTAIEGRLSPPAATVRPNAKTVAEAVRHPFPMASPFAGRCGNGSRTGEDRRFSWGIPETGGILYDSPMVLAGGSGQVTRLLRAWSDGDEAALERLV